MKAPTLVMKFGGTSVENAERIRRAADIVKRYAGEHRMVVVVSALARTTDQILECAQAAASGDGERLCAELESVRRRHEAVIAELFPDGCCQIVHERIAAVLKQLHDFCHALLQLRSVTPQLLDVALPMGEKMSAHLFTAVLGGLGIRSSYVDSADIVITDDRFGDAFPNMEATRTQVQRKLSPLLDEGYVPVVTGYSGSTQKGQPTTLGRGGSDISATILGAALPADEIWIWTDVDGILTTDPRICPDARVLPEITFAEAIELSYYGAKVIHRKSVCRAMENGIPVRIKNSFRPDLPGTTITASSTVRNGPVKAVTAMANTSLITLCGKHDFYVAAEILGRLFLRLGHEHMDILFSMQSSAENSLGLVLRAEDTDRVLASIERLFRSELKQGVLESVTVERDLAVVAVLGENMKRAPAILGRVFSAVSKCSANVFAASQGASDLSICFAVESQSAFDVVKSIHEEFFSSHAMYAHTSQAY